LFCPDCYSTDVFAKKPAFDDADYCDSFCDNYSKALKDNAKRIADEFSKHGETDGASYRSEYVHYFKSDIFIMMFEDFHKSWQQKIKEVTR
jgi:hypothetical protein